MNHLYDIFLSIYLILIYELFRKISFIKIFKKNIKTIFSINSLFKNNISDTARSELFFQFSKDLFISSLKIISIMLLITIPIFYIKIYFFNSLLELKSIFISSIVFLLYFLLKYVRKN